MRFAPLIALALVVSACSGSSEPELTTSLVTTVPRPSSTSTTTTTTLPPLELCDGPSAFPQVLPERVVPGLPDTANVELDEFTVIEGAATAIQFDADGKPVIVVIQGALPPRQFTEPHETLSILDGIPVLVGPIGDGYWAAAWAIPPGERCDLNSLIFYPPIERDEVVAVVESIG